MSGQQLFFVSAREMPLSPPPSPVLAAAGPRRARLRSPPRLSACAPPEASDRRRCKTAVVCCCATRLPLCGTFVGTGAEGRWRSHSVRFCVPRKSSALFFLFFLFYRVVKVCRGNLSHLILARCFVSAVCGQTRAGKSATAVCSVSRAHPLLRASEAKRKHCIKMERADENTAD